MAIKGYADLEVYQMGYDLALRIHRQSQEMPLNEKYELGQQIRKAAISVPANIAEGCGRKDSAKEFKHFLRNAMGSVNEVQVYIDMMKDLGYIDEKTYGELRSGYALLGKKLYHLIKSWNREG